MFFAVIAKDHWNSSALRAQTKARHSVHLDAAEGLRVLQTGPLLDESGSEVGSLLILEAVELATVESFMASDPYTNVGLFAQIEIYPWLWRRGNPYMAGEAAAHVSNVTTQEIKR
jgi:uncharacterized protein YciI